MIVRDPTPTQPPQPQTYNQQVGQRLNEVRKQRWLSLQQVRDLSSGEFKASVLGAYERGDRSISVARLERLATLYDVAITYLLPARHEPGEDVPMRPPVHVRIDLQALKQHSSLEAGALRRVLAGIQRRRGDYNDRVLTIRGQDACGLAAALGLSPEEFINRLDKLGLRRPGDR